MKDATLNIRIEPQIKNNLEDYADQASLSMADFVAQLIDDYPTNVETLKQSERLGNDVQRLKRELDTLNVPRFEVLFDELNNKLVNNRPINNRKDLLSSLSEAFQYELQADEVSVTTQKALVQPILPIQRTEQLDVSADRFNWQRGIFQVAATVVLLFSVALAWRFIKMK